MRLRNVKFFALLVLLVFVFSGCSMYMSGQPSFTLVSTEINENSKNVKVLSTKEKESATSISFLIWGYFDCASHETVVNRFLDKHHADMIIDAKLKNSWFGIPCIFMVNKTTVQGKPAIFVEEGESK